MRSIRWAVHTLDGKPRAIGTALIVFYEEGSGSADAPSGQSWATVRMVAAVMGHTAVSWHIQYVLRTNAISRKQVVLS
ncbi:MAG: hypothetical protein R3C56_36110 [Pirellulaceae bacterium]